MADQRKKTKTRITLPLEEALLRAIELQAAREKKPDRVQWIIEKLEDALRTAGKWP